MAQIDLTGESNPHAPYIDNSQSYVQVHVPNGADRQSPADQIPLNVDGVPTKKATIAVTNAFVRFANPA